MRKTEAPLTIWDNSNIVESYGGVTTPLTFSFAREIYAHVYREFCRIMGVPERVIVAHEAVFDNMLGLVRGRMYYNLLNWHRMLALLPGYRVNRGYMEQMMGVREPLPAEAAAQLVDGSRRGVVGDAIHLAGTLTRLLLNHLTLNHQVAVFSHRITDALAPPAPALEDRRPEELVDHYRELRSRLLHRWHAPLVNDFFAMVFYGLLRQLVSRWLDAQDAALQNDLIGGQGGLVSAEPAIRMRRLAMLASADPQLQEQLIDGNPDGILAACASRPEFLRGYHAYIDKFGERCTNELKLESATLHDDPLPLFRAIGHLAKQLAADGAASGRPADAVHAKPEERVAAALAGRPFRRAIFMWVLRHARRRVRDRENLRFERTRLFGRVRRIFLELGRRLQQAGVLADARDVLYLEADEVLAFVEGRSTCSDLGGLAAVRKREFSAFEATPAPPERFQTRGSVYQAGAALQGVTAKDARTRPAAPDEFRGLGCSPGVVRGRVQIVRDPSRATLTGRPILVAEHTDPGWVTLFPCALGILVERGSLLSHASIVARELGIPAVVSIRGLTEWLRDGDLVEFDGTSGVVRRLGEVKEERCA